MLALKSSYQTIAAGAFPRTLFVELVLVLEREPHGPLLGQALDGDLFAISCRVQIDGEHPSQDFLGRGAGSGELD